MPESPVPTWLVAGVCLLLIVTASVMTAAAAVLTADGPFNLIRIIATDDVFAPNARYLGSLVRQAPTLAGIRVGVKDTYWLSVLLGTGYLVIPAVVWSVALVLSADDAVAFTAVAVTAGITAVSTWFCSVSESVLALALTGLVAVLLARTQHWGWGTLAVACTASVVLIASYETAIATSAILALWAFMRVRAAVRRSERVGCTFVALASLAAIFVGVSGSFSGQNSSNSRSFAYFVVSLEPGEVYVMLACGAALVGATLIANRRGRGLLLTLGLAGTLLAAATFEPTPSAAYAARGAAVIGVLGLQCFLMARWVRRRAPRAPAATERPYRWELAAPVVFVTVMCAANLVALRTWSSDLNVFRARVATASGRVYVDDVLPAGHRRAVWGWTGTSLSLVVRTNSNDGVLVDRNPSYVPFPPKLTRSQIPDAYTWGR
jgi:hypothetical protein